MQAAACPNNEAERLALLHDHRILDTPAEPGYDDLTRLASRFCKAPIALISLIDKDRQWFKSKVGLEVDETHRDLAFCAHAILEPTQLLIVEDSLLDERFATNPLVLGEPKIRFYAGSPLLTPSGPALGTLCVIDREPKSLTEDEQEALRVLGNQVATKLELRHTQNQFAQSELLRAELIRKLTVSNAKLEEFVRGASHDLKAPLHVIGCTAQWLENDLEGYLNDDTRESLQMLRGRVARMDKLLDDLLEYAKIGDGNGARNREMISGDALLENVVALLSKEGFRIRVGAGFTDIRVPRMPLQQVFMNLISNAIKHHHEKRGCIDVSVEENAGSFVFAVKDDGPGIPAEFHEQIFAMFQTLRPRDQVEGSGIGLAMVHKYVELAGGSIELESTLGAGSTFRFSWPKTA